MIYVERILWAIATVVLFASGIYFTFRLKFVQFKLKDMMSSFRSDKKNQGISPFKTLTMTLGARIGVGSLAGIALAIHYGGVGTLFWIWVSTIICSTNAFSESLLGVLYREQDGNNYVGGPSYYMKNGIKSKGLGYLYAIALIFAYIIGFLTVQSNTMVKSITQIYDYNSLIVAIVIAVLALIVILKGLNSIANFSSKLVPVMTAGYFLICIYILLMNANNLPLVIKSIFFEAFNPTSAALGFMVPIIIGFQRGTFSNEAGLGTGAIAAATANTDNPAKQGFIQVLGIYIETLLLSTLTALVIMTSNYKDIIWSNINGIEITQNAFTYHLGPIGNYVVMIAILLFAFSTIITGYYYGESNLKYLFHKLSSVQLLMFKIIVALLLIIGGVSSPTFVWSLADILIVALGLINIYSLFKLKDVIVNEYKYYKTKKKWYN